MITISCILTVYNGALYLDQALQSVIQQTLDDWELIIMDDNSSDEQILEIYKRYWNHPKIRLFKTDVSEEDRYKTVRYSVLHNMAAMFIRGRYVTYLSQDDYYLPDRFQLMIKKFNSNRNIIAVYGDQMINDANGYTAFRDFDEITKTPGGRVDSSSIMHKSFLLEENRWPIEKEYWPNADLVFMNGLNVDFYPVGYVTDVQRLHPDSVRARYMRGELM